MDSRFIIHMIAAINDKANRYLVRELKNHKIKDIAPSHGDLIGALCLVDQMTMKELAACINKDKSTVTALVKKLVSLGYVKKEVDPNDNRVSLVFLSDKGKSIRPDMLDISKKMRERAFRHFSNDDRRTLMELLRKVHENF